MRTLIVAVCVLFLLTKVWGQDLARERHSLDSVTRQVAACKEDTNKVNWLHRLAYHQYWFDTTLAKEYVSQSVVLSNKLGYTRGHARSFLMFGNFAEYAKQYDRALLMYNQAAFHAEQGKLYTETHDAYISLMNIHFYRGEYVYALDVCLRGLKLAREANDISREANYTNLSGFIYRNMKQSENEERAFREYAVLARRSGDSLLVASACTELAQVMLQKQKYDSAITYLDTAYHLYSGHYERHRRAFTHYLYAKTYKAKGNSDSALQHALLAINTSRNIPANKFDVARYYIATGQLYVERNQADLAIAYLDSGLTIALEIAHRENIRDAYHILSVAYSMKEDFTKAYAYQSRYSALQDSLLNEENLRTIAEMSALYELDKKERDLQEIQRAENEASRMRLLYYGLIALGVIVLFLIYNRYRLKQKSALQLTINNQQNEMFQGILSAQEKERQRIAGDLHDGLGSLLSTAKLQLQLMGNSDLSAEQKKHYEAALDLVNRSSQDLRNISHSIMPAPLKKLGLIAALESVIGGLNVAGQIQFQLQSHNMGARIEEEKELALYNITMELINNAAKHSCAKNVVLQFVRHENNLSLTIEDDGKGFDPKKSVAGIGLSNIRKRVAYFKGQFEIDSNPGSPTTISIDFPVS